MSKPVLIGELYDPLPSLAEQVIQTLRSRRKTVWTDSSGQVFMSDPAFVSDEEPQTIIGTYDRRSSVLLIKGDLRLALRELASSWITDWREL